jgi:hypothetical protein
MVKSKFPALRRKGGRTAEDEAGLEDLPQRPQPTMAKPERPTGSDKGEPFGTKDAGGTGHKEADSAMKGFLKKRKHDLLRKGR